uniref:CRAL-TRIO domain-containing protein n=1 Tax=Oncorhynchus mykiss TaxID=8022 RepID=A0A8C7QMY8_ONCMY
KLATVNLHSNNMEQREEVQEEEEEEKDMHIPRSEVMVIRLNCFDPPSSLALMEPQPRKKRLMAPALSLTLDRSDSAVSDDYATAALIPSPDDDLGLDFDLDAMETPSDSESLHFPVHDMDLEGEDRVQGTGQTNSLYLWWRRFCMGDPPQESLVNMSVLEPYLRVLSHGGYFGDGSNDIIVFSSCYLPENTMENYQYVMDNLFRYIVGTLDLMVAENYVIVYLCAMAQRNKLPGIGWLRECYTTIDRRLRKSLKALYIVHPTWYIKALITIIKPFISSKFSRKLQFIDRFQELSQHIPIERVQIPDCVRQ